MKVRTGIPQKISENIFYLLEVSCFPMEIQCYFCAMTMEHISRSFTVSLSIIHPDMDPSEISTTMGLTPENVTRAGMPRTGRQGQPLPGTYNFSCWTHSFDCEGEPALGEVLEPLVERLQTHREFFHRIGREGGSVELFCGVFAAGNWDEILSHELMGKLAALHIDLRLDVYPKDAVA